MYPSKLDADAAFDQLDRAGSGAITRQQFEEFAARQRNPGQLAPVPERMQAAPSGGTYIAQKQLYGVIGGLGGGGDLSEEARLLKDTRRFFALAGPIILMVLAFCPVVSALALLHSKTYLFFSGWGSSIGGIMILTVVLVALWMNRVMGVGMPYMPLSNPFHFLLPLYERLKSVPSEIFVVLVTVFVLLSVWHLAPVWAVGGVMGVVHAIGNAIRIFDIMAVSSNPAATILASAFSVVALYMLTLNYFFARAKPEHRRASMNMFVIWAFFVLLLGLSFMLLSLPISNEASKASNELMLTCETGPRTGDLYVTSQALQTIRQSPGCAPVLSIEDCLGFQHSPVSRLLKQMEYDFRCAGFCYNPSLQVGGSSEPSATSFKYPPTLFSLANYQSSCDGMAARNMDQFVTLVGTQVRHQGYICTLIALFMTLMYMISVCGGYRQKEFFAGDGMHSSYGSVS